MPDNQSYEDKLLLKQIAAGDEAAFSSFFHAFKSKVYSIAFSFVQDKAISEEIVQDIFLKIWLTRQQMHEIEDINNWLFIVARNKSVSVLHKIATEYKKSRELALVTGEADKPDQTVPASLETREFRDLLQEAVQLLSPQQQKVFELVKVHGYSRNEAAKALGISPHTVKVHLSNSLPVIRQYLASRLGKTVAFLLFGHFF